MKKEAQSQIVSTKFVVAKLKSQILWHKEKEQFPDGLFFKID